MAWGRDLRARAAAANRPPEAEMIAFAAAARATDPFVVLCDRAAEAGPFQLQRCLDLIRALDDVDAPAIRTEQA